MKITIWDEVEKLLPDYIYANNMLAYYSMRSHYLDDSDIESIINDMLIDNLNRDIGITKSKAADAKWQKALSPHFDDYTGDILYLPYDKAVDHEAYWETLPDYDEDYDYDAVDQRIAKRREWYNAHYDEMQKECEVLTEWKRLLEKVRAICDNDDSKSYAENYEIAEAVAQKEWLLTHDDLSGTERHIYCPDDL